MVLNLKTRINNKEEVCTKNFYTQKYSFHLVIEMIKIENVRLISVIGAGTMGTLIGQAFATYGYQVKLRDVDEHILKRSVETMRSGRFGLNRLVEKGKITQAEADAILSRVKTTMDLEEALKDSDFIIEAVPENMELKKKILKQLDELSPPDSILASNTSSLSISEIAMATKRPERVIGMHFFNPPPIMKLIEVIKGIKSSSEAIEVAVALSKKIDHIPIVCKDSPAFIASRILVAAVNEAFWLLQEGVATVEDIDTACKLGLGWPMGPFELCDLTGLDINLDVLEYLQKETGDSKYRVPLIMKKLVRGNYLGKKVNKTIYDYAKKEGEK